MRDRRRGLNRYGEDVRTALGLALVLAACSAPPGDVAPDAATPSPDAPGADADVRPREMRGVWITRFAYNSQASL